MSVRHIGRALLTVSLLVVAGVAPVGCKSTSQQAVQRSEKTVDTVAGLRAEVVAAGTQLDRSMSSLNAVIAGSGDRRTAFKNYSSELAKLQSQADKAKSRADDLRARANEYIAKWEAEAATVSNPDLKAQAEARRATVRDRIDEIQVAADRGNAAYEPLMRELRDIETVLSNDLTDAGVQGVAPVAQQAITDAATLRDRINGLVAELDRLTGQMSPRG